MKTVTMILSLSLMLAAAAGNAKEDGAAAEGAGIGGGALVGALVGGPVGAILGAGLGAYVADRAHTARAVPGLQADLDAAHARIDDLNHHLVEANTDLEELRRATSIDELEQAISDGVQVEVMFATDQSELSDQVAGRIADLAAVVRTVPDLAIRLDGYADQRGDEDYNDALSDQRALAVRTALVANGIEARRISTHAHGERKSRAGDGDLDAYALERRVSISLMLDTAANVAQVE